MFDMFCEQTTTKNKYHCKSVETLSATYATVSFEDMFRFHLCLSYIRVLSVKINVAYVKAWQHMINNTCGEIVFQFNTYIIANMVIIAAQKYRDVPTTDMVEWSRVEAVPNSVCIRRVLFLFFRVFAVLSDESLASATPMIIEMDSSNPPIRSVSRKIISININAIDAQKHTITIIHTSPNVSV